jgi:hypothetical protein
MNGSAGSGRLKKQKQEIAESNGAVLASKTESGGPVVGLAVRIVEIIVIRSTPHKTSSASLPEPDCGSVGSDVRFGSLADMTDRLCHVRFTPDSGHSSAQVGCPLSANTRHDATISVASSRCRLLLWIVALDLPGPPGSSMATRQPSRLSRSRRATSAGVGGSIVKSPVTTLPARW